MQHIHDDYIFKTTSEIEAVVRAIIACYNKPIFDITSVSGGTTLQYYIANSWITCTKSARDNMLGYSHVI